MQAYILNEATILGEKSFRDLVFREHQLQPKFLEHEIADYCFGNLEQSSTNMKFSEYCFWNPKLVTKQYLQDIVLRIASNFQNLKFEKYCFGNLKPCTEHNMNIAGY